MPNRLNFSWAFQRCFQIFYNSCRLWVRAAVIRSPKVKPPLYINVPQGSPPPLPHSQICEVFRHMGIKNVTNFTKNSNMMSEACVRTTILHNSEIRPKYKTFDKVPRGISSFVQLTLVCWCVIIIRGKHNINKNVKTQLQKTYLYSTHAIRQHAVRISKCTYM